MDDKYTSRSLISWEPISNDIRKNKNKEEKTEQEKTGIRGVHAFFNLQGVQVQWSGL